MALSIRRRLTFGTLFLFGLLLLSAGLGIFQLNRLKQDAQAILVDNYETVRYVQGMQRALHLGDPNAFEEQLVLQEANITETNEAERTTEVRQDLERWKDDGVASPALHDHLQAILDLNLEAIDRKNKAALNTAQEAQQWLWGIAALTLVVGLAFSLTFPRLVTEPIAQLRQAVEQVARGNYRHRVPTFRSDELGALSEAFNGMSGELERWEGSNLAVIMAEKARVEAVLNSLQDAALGVDHEGRVLFVNRKATELLGMESSELIGASVQDLVQRNDLLRHVIADAQGKPFKAVVEGTEQFFAASQAPISNGTEVIGTVHLMHNITLFQERDQNKTMFLATISHELKTPLASTDLGLSLIERQQVSPDIQDILADLRKDHQRLVRIVSELLDMAQVESGRMRVEVGEVPLRNIVRSAVDAVSSTAKKERIAIEIQLEASDVNVRADAEKATWAVVNLLSNALRHAPKESIISVRSALEGNRAMIVISDKGPGIAPEQQEHLFERFAPHSSTGTGLGLSIARDLMRAMGGDLMLMTSDRSGSVFAMYFAPSA